MTSSKVNSMINLLPALKRLLPGGFLPSGRGEEGGQGDDGGEVTLGADGGEAIDPSQMPQDAN